MDIDRMGHDTLLTLLDVAGRWADFWLAPYPVYSKFRAKIRMRGRLTRGIPPNH
jgi:hypothetical protein